MNQTIKTILFCFTITLLFYGCSSTTVQYPEPSPTAVDGSFISKENKFQFGEIEYRAEYGTLTVPENRRNAASRLIHLPVLRIHARTENNNEPIFGLAGGPGHSNFRFRPVDSLLYDHDCIIVGYRGVDGSTVLDCPEVTQALQNSNEDLLGEESIKEIAHAWRTSADRLKSTGIDLNGYTMPETVEDLEAARKALKYDRIHLVSESYGTRVAYLYGVMHPEIIHRSVMIGVAPPGGFIWDPQRVDEQIRYYSRLWAKDSAMSQQCPDLAAAMQKVLKNLPRKWLFIPINPGKVRVMTFCMLFHRKEAAIAFDSYVAAEHGDYSGIALMSLAFDYMFPEMFVWGEFTSKAVSADMKYWKGEPAGVNNENRILGAPLNEFAWKSLQYGSFTIDMIPESLQVPVQSDVETFMLSGSVDFSDPPERATALLAYLKNGRQIIMSEAGHVGDLRYLQLDATKALIAEYINTGIADTSKIKHVPMDFEVSWGFPAIAKATVGAGVVLLTLLAGGIYWLAN